MDRLLTVPNLLSILRIVLTPLFVWTLFLGEPYVITSLVIFSAAALTDLVDGYYARRYAASSLWGAFLDPIADKILVCTALISFSIIGFVPLWAVLIVVARDLLITGLRVVKMSGVKPLETSFLAKSKTFLQFIALYLMFFCLLLAPHNQAVWYIAVAAAAKIMVFCVVVLTVYSGLDYLRRSF